MKYELRNHYSSNLEREMSYGVYGHAGRIVIAK